MAWCISARAFGRRWEFSWPLDAETGAPKWTNNQVNYLSHVVGGGDVIEDNSGLSPQGYLLAIGDRLIVPNGRAMPSGFELATGKLVYFMIGGKRDCRVTAHGKYAFVGDFAVVNVYDLREAASKWAGRGAKKIRDHHAFGGNFADWECPSAPYKMVDGCDAFSAFSAGIAYGFKHGIFYAYDLAASQTLPIRPDGLGLDEKQGNLVGAAVALAVQTAGCRSTGGAEGRQPARFAGKSVGGNLRPRPGQIFQFVHQSGATPL